MTDFLKFITFEAFALLFSGCTLLGLGAGALIDSTSSSLEATPVDDALQSSGGRTMIVTTKYGATLQGEYQGTQPFTRQERDSVFSVRHAVSLGRLLPPALGDTITLFTDILFMSEKRGVLNSLNSSAIELFDPMDSSISTVTVRHGMRVVDERGLEWRANKFRDFCATKDAILLKVESGTKRVLLSEVASIEVEARGNAKLIFGVVGLATDLWFLTHSPFGAH